MLSYIIVLKKFRKRNRREIILFVRHFSQIKKNLKVYVLKVMCDKLLFSRDRLRLNSTYVIKFIIG